MLRTRETLGFTLIELLLVLAILGIITGIAIPSFMGQRRRARIIGDAMSNAKVLSMQMEQFKADNGIYGPAGGTATWTPASNVPALTGYAANPCPTFTPSGNTKMNYTLTVGANSLSYVLDVDDPSIVGTPLVYQTDQNGAELFRLF